MPAPAATAPAQANLPPAPHGPRWPWRQPSGWRQQATRRRPPAQPPGALRLAWPPGWRPAERPQPALPQLAMPDPPWQGLVAQTWRSKARQLLARVCSQWPSCGSALPGVRSRRSRGSDTRGRRRRDTHRPRPAPPPRAGHGRVEERSAATPPKALPSSPRTHLVGDPRLDLRRRPEVVGPAPWPGSPRPPRASRRRRRRRTPARASDPGPPPPRTSPRRCRRSRGSCRRRAARPAVRAPGRASRRRRWSGPPRCWC
mmetsp:Transcript_4328/g.13227  ORF Transcript_4328/g.13227 Transcript_4328/m.13227 type:complete len:257 (+) Transcript_4328:1224-1994(+)